MNALPWERHLAASCTGAGSVLATGEVLVPATEVTAHLPSGSKWKKGNIAREGKNKKKSTKERRQCKAKGKNVCYYGYIGEEIARKRNLTNGTGLVVLATRMLTSHP